MLKNRTLLVVLAFLAPLLVLTMWFAPSAQGRCTVYKNAGYIYLAKGTVAPPQTQLQSSAAWFSAALASGCQAAPVTFGLGQAYAGLGRPQAAIAALDDGNARGDMRRFLVGQIFDRSGQEEDAWREYRSLPLDAAAHFYKLGNRAEARGDLRAALRYYSVSTTINPAAFKSYYGAAYVYWQELGDEEQAVRLIRQGLAVDPTSSDQRDFYRGLLCYHEQKMDCALAAWTAAARNPSKIGTGPDPRQLAYEMLGQTLVARQPARARPVAMLQ